jgi:hypothetical protein
MKIELLTKEEMSAVRKWRKSLKKGDRVCIVNTYTDNEGRVRASNVRNVTFHDDNGVRVGCDFGNGFISSPGSIGMLYPVEVGQRYLAWNEEIGAGFDSEIAVWRAALKAHFDAGADIVVDDCGTVYSGADTLFRTPSRLTPYKVMA